MRAQADFSYGSSIVRGALTGSATILCRAFGSPRPIIYWSKNNVNITNQANPSIMITNSNISSIAIVGNLTIRSLNRSNFGSYICSSYNRRNTNSPSSRAIQLQQIGKSAKVSSIYIFNAIDNVPAGSCNAYYQIIQME